MLCVFYQIKNGKRKKFIKEIMHFSCTCSLSFNQVEEDNIPDVEEQQDGKKVGCWMTTLNTPAPLIWATFCLHYYVWEN